MLIAIKTTGCVAIMALVDDAAADSAIAAWQLANPGRYISHRTITPAELPADRSRRDLWSDVNGTIVIDPSLEPVPTVISRFQGRSALMQAGLLDDAEALVAGADAFTKLAWAETAEWQRTSPTVAALAAGLGLTAAQVDDLFRVAKTITA